jgi:hypothetical protein
MGTGTQCTEDGQSTRSVAEAWVGSIAMTRALGPNSVVVANAFPGIPPRQPTAAFLRIRTISTCPPTFSENTVEVDLPNYANAPGASTTSVSPVFAPVSGAVTGVLYVVSPGELKYIE